MLNKYFPLIKLSRKKFKDKPWITNGIKVSIRHRNRLFKKYIEKRTDANELSWKRYRNKVNDCIKAAETHYYQTLLTKHNNHCQNLWKIFGKLIKKNKHKVKISKLKIDNTIISNPNQITESFNSFFTKIGENLAQSINNNEPEAYKEYLGDPIAQSLSLSETNPSEIEKTT